MLIFAPTPLGNLKDISLRTLEAMERADIVLCEDVRVTKRLFFLLGEMPIVAKNFTLDPEKKNFFPSIRTMKMILSRGLKTEILARIFSKKM